MSRLTRLFVPLALAASLIAGPMAVAASATDAPSSRLDEILTRGTLRVGTTGDYRPFTFLNKETGQFEGYDIDVANALGAVMGVKVEFVQTAWPKMTEDFKADKFDIAMGGVSITIPRQKLGYFTDPIMREGKTPIARCADVEKFAAIDEINQPATRVIVNPGGTNDAFARANFPKANVTVFPDNTKIFDEIAAGHADVMVTDSSETRYQQKLHPGVLCAVHPDKPFDFAEKAYWLQRDVPLQQFVNQALHIMGATGKTQAIFAKYFGN
jgi:cyclohexadienyl dehydratase